VLKVCGAGGGACQTLGLHTDTVQRLMRPETQDALVVHDTYLELAVNLVMRTDDDPDLRPLDMATLVLMGDVLVSVHPPQCIGPREVMAQSQMVPIPPEELMPSSSNVTFGLHHVAVAAAAAAAAAAGGGGGVSATNGGGGGGGMAQGDGAGPTSTPTPPPSSAPTPAPSGVVAGGGGGSGARHLPGLRPDQLLCEILYAFVRDCALVMQRTDDAVEELHELMLELDENERSDFLRRLTVNRNSLVTLRRQLAVKRALLRNLLVGRASAFVSPDAAAYLRYIFEQLDYYGRAVGMAKDSLNQVQANYLAKINVDMADVAQRTNDTVKVGGRKRGERVGRGTKAAAHAGPREGGEGLSQVFTILATISLPINMVSGIMGMNVYYPSTADACACRHAVGAQLTWAAHRSCGGKHDRQRVCDVDRRHDRHHGHHGPRHVARRPVLISSSSSTTLYSAPCPRESKRKKSSEWDRCGGRKEEERGGEDGERPLYMQARSVLRCLEPVAALGLDKRVGLCQVRHRPPGCVRARHASQCARNAHAAHAITREGPVHAVNAH
jgi:hypothetical protein